MIRHALATLAYRAGKSLRGAPDGFSDFTPGAGSRTAGQILAHMCDLMDWGESIVQGQQRWHNSPAGEWEGEVARFFDGVARFDGELASHPPDDALAAKLFQGPIADALQHTGQIALLRRLAGSAIRAENFFIAEIATGRLGPDQRPPRQEF